MHAMKAWALALRAALRLVGSVAAGRRVGAAACSAPALKKVAMANRPIPQRGERKEEAKP